jgi:hypothetical protein
LARRNEKKQGVSIQPTKKRLNNRSCKPSRFLVATSQGGDAMVSIPREREQSQPRQHDLASQLSQAKQRIRELERQDAWERQLFGNPHLSASQKLTLWATVPEIVKGSPNEDGLTHVNITYVAKKIGMSAKITGKNLQQLAEANGLTRKEIHFLHADGLPGTQVLFAFTPHTTRPQTIQPPTPRNHGGVRKTCQDCGSQNLIEQRTIICLDCGCEQHTSQHLVNPAEGQDENQEASQESRLPLPCQEPSQTQQEQLIAAPPLDNLTSVFPPEELLPNLSTGDEKPPTPPHVPASPADPAPAILSEQMKERPQPAVNQEAERQREHVAQLLLDLAGDTPEHIVMNANPASMKKYLTVHRPLTLADMRLHLQGKKTVGATLSFQDGTTRAQCFDVDDPHGWQQLQEAATFLIAKGYHPLLEPSAAGRGGHLWLIFTERVNAQAAYKTVCAIAPGLTEIGEYWPGTTNQKVRLPAGKYVSPTFSQWSRLTNAAGAAVNVVDLLDSQTPASLIPAAAPTDEPGGERVVRQGGEKPHPHRVQREPDEQHRRKYGQHRMWVEWPSEQYLIDRFNAQYSIDDFATFERNGMMDASLIGRPERTASVGVTRDGEHFTDFGAGARQPDGSQDGGDTFEFYIRSRNLSKAQVLRELGQAVNQEASTEILRAARAGEPLPAWVREIVTERGRQIYNENARRHGHQPLDREDTHKGG